MTTHNSNIGDKLNPRPRSPVFDHERLAVYNLQLEFIKWVTPVLEQALNAQTGRPREICDQLDRASVSSVLNTAEGNGKRQRQVRAKFFDDARGSATECAACLDVLVAKGILAPEKTLAGKSMLLQTVCMLSGLVERFDGSTSTLREDAVEYRIGAQEGSDIKSSQIKRQRQRQRKN